MCDTVDDDSHLQCHTLTFQTCQADHGHCDSPTQGSLGVTDKGLVSLAPLSGLQLLDVHRTQVLLRFLVHDIWCTR